MSDTLLYSLIQALSPQKTIVNHPSVAKFAGLIAGTWYPIAMDSGWSTVSGYAVPSYRVTINGDLQLTGLADYGSPQTVNLNLNGSNPLPPAYCPATAKMYREWNYNGPRGTAHISSGGVIQMLANSTYPARYIEIDATIPLGI